MPYDAEEAERDRANASELLLRHQPASGYPDRCVACRNPFPCLVVRHARQMRQARGGIYVDVVFDRSATSDQRTYLRNLPTGQYTDAVYLVGSRPQVLALLLIPNHHA